MCCFEGDRKGLECRKGEEGRGKVRGNGRVCVEGERWMWDVFWYLLAIMNGLWIDMMVDDRIGWDLLIVCARFGIVGIGMN